MDKKSLLGLGVVALVGMALGACSGPATSPDKASAQPSEKAAQAKRYSNGELLDLVKQIKTADGKYHALHGGAINGYDDKTSRWRQLFT
ncbi:hypothetical protein ABIE18_001507 [Arthrobacter sp. 2762]|jgi:hypothetical protein